MTFTMYLILAVILSFALNIWIVRCGFKTKKVESLMLLQTLPTVLLFLLIYGGFELTGTWFPTVDGDGYTFGFLVVLPTMAIAVASTMILGILGFTRMKEENSPLLVITSFMATMMPLANIFGFFGFLILFVYLLLMKVERKWKQKRDKAPDIIG